MTAGTPVTNLPERRRYRGGLGLPVILVGIGIVLLLNNFGIVDWNVREVIVYGWPLLIVVAGIDSLIGGRGLVLPLIAIGLGAAIFLNGAGLWVWDVWGVLARYWPVLLIAAGADLVLGRRSAVGAIIGLVAVVATVALVMWLFGAQLGASRETRTVAMSQSAEGVESADVRLEAAAARLELGSAYEAGVLLAGDVNIPSNRTLERSFRMDGSRAVVRLVSSDPAIAMPFNESTSSLLWDLSLSRRIPTYLSVKLGVGDVNLTLTSLELTGLAVNIGVGETTLRLPSTGEFTGRVEGAIGNIIILVPRGAAVRIDASTGLGSVEAPPNYRVHDGVYSSPAYDSGPGGIELRVSEAIGSITIREVAE